MNVIDALRKRRAVKGFDPAFQTPLKMTRSSYYKEALANAPSAF